MRLCKIIIPCQWKPASYGAYTFKGEAAQTEIDSCRDGSRAGCNCGYSQRKSDLWSMGRVYFIGKQPSSIVGAKRICPWLCYIDTECQLLYKCDNYYNAQADAGIAFDDPDLAIDWPIDKEQAILSEKDQHHPTLEAFEAENPFVYGEI